MNRAEYVSRKVMDRYQDRMSGRLERMWNRIQELEAEALRTQDSLAKLAKALAWLEYCAGDVAPVVDGE